MRVHRSDVRAAVVGAKGWLGGLDAAALLRLSLVMVAALLLTNLGLPQPITGPLVNALLLLTAEWLGLGQAIAVGLVTPLGALTHGTLPLPLAFVVPIIMLGNGVYASVYVVSSRSGRWLAVGLAALAKFASVYGMTMLLVSVPLRAVLGGGAAGAALPPALLRMMGWPQLATALAGGILALGVRRWWRTRRG